LRRSVEALWIIEMLD